MDGSALMERLSLFGNRLFAQTSAMGALPTLYAATAPGVRGGDYFGPGGLGEMRGHPKKVRSSARSHDLGAAARLWQVSRELTAVSFAPLGGWPTLCAPWLAFALLPLRFVARTAGSLTN